tara:strand:+ start:971 stop:2230 length:1260 start_codon:yes stop_codon:yes gene_type:complete
VNNNYYLRFQSGDVLGYFIYLIPLLLLTGSFLPDLFLSISGLIFIYILYTSNEKKYLFNKFTFLFVIFYFYLIFSSLISEHPDFSLRSTTFYFRYGLFSLAVWYVIDNNPNFLRNFLIFLAFAFLIAILDGYYQFYNGSHLFTTTPLIADRLSLPFNQKLVLGAYISRLFPLLLALLLLVFKPGRKLYLIIGIILIFTDTLVYLSGERTALGLMMISTVFILIFLDEFRTLRLFTLVISIFVIFFISILNPDIKERNIDYTFEQIGLNDESNKINLLSPQHESHFKSAWRMYNDNKVFGIGPNNFRKLCDKEKYLINHLSCSTHPHNTYIQMLSETGVIGIIFILYFVFYISKSSLLSLISFKNHIYLRLSNYQVCLLACFVLTLFPFLPTLSFFNNWINVIYYLPLGFYLQSIYSKSN